MDILDMQVLDAVGQLSVQPTLEQQAIIDAAQNSQESLVITAMAGTGKTTSLQMTAKALPVRPSLMVVFNVRNKKELEKKFPGHFDVKTANGLGHVAWGRAIGRRCTVDDKKVLTATKEVVNANNLELDSDDFYSLLALVRRAKVCGLVTKQYASRAIVLVEDTMAGWEAVADTLHLDVTEDMALIASQILAKCIKQSYGGVIDYDDQIYMSALFGGVFQRYPLVMVDEVQDLSPLNHIQVQRSAADRLIVVGDPRQAIYAFRGADSASMDHLRKLRDSWIELPLSVTFRCPKAIVARQQQHAEGFTAAPSNIEGEVLHWTEKPWTLKDALALGAPVAVLCRNNAPLMSAAMRIIKSGIGCTVLGREIGKSLATLAKKLIKDQGASREACIEAIASWKDSEIALAHANEKEERVAIIRDKGDCLLAILEHEEVKDGHTLLRTLDKIFSSENLNVILSTGHKAKGMEWPTVIHLDPFRVPSKYARKALGEGNPIPMEQDLNLRYVIETRAKERLILANLKEME